MKEIGLSGKSGLEFSNLFSLLEVLQRIQSLEELLRKIQQLTKARFLILLQRKGIVKHLNIMMFCKEKILRLTTANHSAALDLV